MIDYRLLQTADIHLGHRQYNLAQRERDMVSSFNHTLKQVQAHDANAIIIPGDLFHSRDLRPKVLQAAEEALGRVPDDVPVLVSPGNHDENLTRRPVTWLEYLHRQDKITLLQADLSSQGHSNVAPAEMFPSPEAATKGRGTGSERDVPGYVDLEAPSLDGPLRVFGLQYRGGYIDTALDDVAAAIRAVAEQAGDPAQTVLLAHFGVEEEAPDLGATVRYADLTAIEPLVDYLALGHIHKPYRGPDEDTWLFNSGALEAHNTQEATWKLGYFTVDFTSDGVEATHHRSKRRPFYRVTFEVDAYDTWGDLKTGFDERVADEQEQVATHCRRDEYTAQNKPRVPVIDLRLTGHLSFDRQDLNVDTLERTIIDEYDACYCQTQVGVTTAEILDLLDDMENDAVFTDSGALRTDLLEGEVFEQVATNTAYSNNTAAMAQTLARAKEMAMKEDAGGDALADYLQQQRQDTFPGGVGAVDVTYAEAAASADASGVDSETFQAVHTGEEVDPVEAAEQATQSNGNETLESTVTADDGGVANNDPGTGERTSEGDKASIPDVEPDSGSTATNENTSLASWIEEPAEDSPSMGGDQE